MTQNESSVLVDFVRERKDHLETASAIHECWPEIKEQVVRAFYDALWKARVITRTTSFGCAILATLMPSSPRASATGLCIRNLGENMAEAGRQFVLQNNMRGPNGWSVGIYSPIEILEDTDRQQRYGELREHLNKSVALTEPPDGYWPWWIWVDDKYRDWDSIIPAMNEENKVRGDITNYFVDKLVAIANAALPFIDDIEAPPGSPRSGSR